MTLAERLAELLGSEALAFQERIADYAVDGQVPQAVVFPASVEGVSSVIQVAAEEGLAITPRGGGTQMALGNPSTRLDIVLGMGRLNRVVEYSAPDFTLAVEAGATLASVQEFLSREGQRMPLDVPLPGRATVGGILAANSTGPRRLLYNLPRDWLLGVRVAQADGSVTKSGGRVVKNATGFDLDKLYVGSLGTLGIIVEATLRLVPLPKAEESLVASYDDVHVALSAAWRMVSQKFTPQSVELLVGEARRALSPGLREGAGKATLVVSLAGWPGAVMRMLNESRKLLADATRVERLSGRESAALSQALTDLGWGGVDQCYTSLKASLFPSRVGDAVRVLESLPHDGFQRGFVVGVGCGGLRLLLFAEEGLPDRAARARSYALSARKEVGKLGGHLVVERCPAEVKAGLDVWGKVPGGIEVMRRIKAELDPKGLFNPGRFVEGI